METMTTREIAKVLKRSRQALGKAGVTGQNGILPRRRGRHGRWLYAEPAARFMIRIIQERDQLSDKTGVLFGAHMHPDFARQAPDLWSKIMKEEPGLQYNQELFDEVLAAAGDPANGLTIEEVAERLNRHRTLLYKSGLVNLLPRRQDSGRSPFRYDSAAVEIVRECMGAALYLDGGLDLELPPYAISVWESARDRGYRYDEELLQAHIYWG